MATVRKRKVLDEAKVFQRMIAPEKAGIPTEAARFVVSLRFHPNDIARINELSEVARAGTLSSAEQDELNAYERMGTFLGILQAKARLSLAR